MITKVGYGSAYDIWKIEKDLKPVDGPYHNQDEAIKRANELTTATGITHLSVALNSQFESLLLKRYFGVQLDVSDYS